MLCPLLKAETMTHYSDTGEEKRIMSATFLPCLKERCAWWVAEEAQCAIRSQSKEVKLFETIR